MFAFFFLTRYVAYVKAIWSNCFAFRPQAIFYRPWIRVVRVLGCIAFERKPWIVTAASVRKDRGNHDCSIRWVDPFIRTPVRFPMNYVEYKVAQYQTQPGQSSERQNRPQAMGQVLYKLFFMTLNKRGTLLSTQQAKPGGCMRRDPSKI